MHSRNPTIVDIFQSFITNITSSQNRLIILGDFFDYWIGDDHTDKLYHKITNLLKQASDGGLEILFMRGNRDFLISKKFKKLSCVEVIPDPYYIEVANQKIALTHGDLLCTEDTSYHTYRKWIAYNMPLRFLFMRLPLFIRQRIANKTRDHSQDKNTQKPNIDVTEEGILKYLDDAKIMIHGHTHKMAVHKEKNYTRYVLGDWFKTGNYIKIDKNCNIVQHPI